MVALTFNKKIVNKIVVDRYSNVFSFVFARSFVISKKYRDFFMAFAFWNFNFFGVLSLSSVIVMVKC